MARIQNEDKIIYWRKMVRKFKVSSLSVSEFSKKHGITPHKLTYWKTRLRDKKCTDKTKPFIEVKRKSQENSTVSLSINDVLTLNFSSPPSPEWISELISNVKKAS
ncbi:MAG: hypothetical protein ISR65_20760 [Bacteriovoracaceae bacterium]|nr:hypothetical protein [Bacteriovoracaceae bacterium]